MTSPYRILSLFLSAVALTVLQAQPARPVTSPSSSANPGDETPITLSAFEVSADAAQGYATTSSTSASRLAVAITELSTSVIAINEKLIADLVAVDPEDTLNLIGGVTAYAETGSAKQNRISMRGYTSSSAQRDGFTDLLYGLNGGFSYIFIDRMEIMKGPNGIMYGQNNPGGILNLVSKKPLAKPRTRITAIYGAYHSHQEDLDTSGFVDRGHQWGYRLSASYRNSDGPLNFPGDGTKGYYAINPTVRFRAKNGLEVWGWAGWVRDQSPRLNRIVRGFKSADGKGAYLMSVVDDGGAHNVLTNLSNVRTDNYEFGATKSFNLGPVRLDVRLLGRYSKQSDNGTLVRTSGGNGRTDTFVDKAGNIINTAINTDSRNIDITVAETNLGGWFRDQVITSKTSTFTMTRTYATDFAFSFKLGPTQHRLLLFGTYNPINQDSIPGINGFNYTVSTVAALTSLGVPIVNGQPRVWLYPSSTNHLIGISPAAVIKAANVISAQSTTNLTSDQYGTGVMERMNFWQRRAFLIGGTRFTDLRSTTTTGTGKPVPTSDTSWTSSFGAVVKAYKGDKGEVAVFVNSNKTFIPVYTLDSRLANVGQKYPDQNVSISEVGVKLDLLDSRAVGTFTVFDMTHDHVLVSDIDVSGAITGTPGRSFNTPAGEQKTRGWDADLSFNVRRGLDVILSYGLRHSRLADGHKPSGQPTANSAAMVRYEVQTGALKNLSLLWNYTWWSDSILNNRTYWTVPPGDLHTAVIGYRWHRYTFRLRIENVFDHLSLKPGTNETAVGVTNNRNGRFSVDWVW
jgi:outer membrane receptor protein involved in Fe transport